MCSRDCSHRPAQNQNAVGGGVILLAARAARGKCCKKHPQAHKGGCVSPDPNGFFPEERAPNLVPGQKEDAKVDDAKGKQPCACGKRMIAVD
jgi:hypothetical protein